MSNPWQKLASISAKIKSLATRMCSIELDDVPFPHHDVPPLIFPELPSRLPQLVQLNLSKDCMDFLFIEFIKAVQNLDEILLAQYYDNVPKLRGNTDRFMPRSAYIEAMQKQLLALRTQSIERLWNTLLLRAQVLADADRSKQANLIIGNEPPSSIESEPSTKRKRGARGAGFTEQQTGALTTLLERADQFTSEEKQYIAQTLGLTKEQVNRWFCNARARKKAGVRPVRAGSTDSIRTVSSDATITPSPDSTSDKANMQQYMAPLSAADETPQPAKVNSALARLNPRLKNRGPKTATRSRSTIPQPSNPIPAPIQFHPQSMNIMTMPVQSIPHAANQISNPIQSTSQLETPQFGLYGTQTVAQEVPYQMPTSDTGSWLVDQGLPSLTGDQTQWSLSTPQPPFDFSMPVRPLTPPEASQAPANDLFAGINLDFGQVFGQNFGQDFGHDFGPS